MIALYSVRIKKKNRKLVEQPSTILECQAEGSSSEIESNTESSSTPLAFSRQESQAEERSLVISNKTEQPPSYSPVMNRQESHVEDSPSVIMISTGKLIDASVASRETTQDKRPAIGATDSILTTPHQASPESDDTPSARVATSEHNATLRQRLPQNNMARFINDTATPTPAADHQPVTSIQPFTREMGDTHNVSAEVPGEACSISENGVAMAPQHGFEEESACPHQEAIPVFNVNRSENQRISGQLVQMETCSKNDLLQKLAATNCIVIANTGGTLIVSCETGLHKPQTL